MTTDSTTTDDDANPFLGAAWFDPIEAGIRGQIRGFIEEWSDPPKLDGGAVEIRRPCGR